MTQLLDRWALLCVLLVICIAGTGGLLFLDAAYVKQVWTHARSYDFVPVTAVVKRAEPAAEDASNAVRVWYEYQFSGQYHKGSDVWQPASMRWSKKHAEQYVANHSPGMTVTVYVNTNDPSQSRLKRGIPWTFIWLLCFFIPFHAFVVFFWYLVWHLCVQPWKKWPAGMPSENTDDICTLYQPGMPRPLILLMTVSIASLLGLFGAGLAMMWINGPLPAVVSLTVVVVCGITAYVKTKHPRTLNKILTLDTRTRLVSVHDPDGWKDTETFSVDRVLGVSIGDVRIARATRSSINLHLAGDTPSLTVTSLDSHGQAERVADWLCDKIGARRYDGVLSKRSSG